MPGLGGVGFTDGANVPGAINSNTPYIQLYCQEKAPTYAAFGNKQRGPNNLDAIPARSITLKAMLECDGALSNRLEMWLAGEARILGHPILSRSRSFPPRLEVRTSLESLVDTTWNTVVALGEMFQPRDASPPLRHFDKDDWFRWKAVRAEHLARFPAAVFGKPHLNPSDWTIIHALLSAQGLIHGLHSRASGITIERDILNLNTSYFRVQEQSGGLTTYDPVTATLSLKDRARGELYRAFFPAGNRTLAEWYDPVKGLYPEGFMQKHVALSNSQELWTKKVRRGIGCHSTTTIDKLKGKIVFPKSGRSTMGHSRLQAKRYDHNSLKFEDVIKKDKRFAQMETDILQKLEEYTSGTLRLSCLEAQKLESYLETTPDWEASPFVVRFWRSLGLSHLKEDAVRLEQMRYSYEHEGRELIMDDNSLIQLKTQLKTRRALESTPSQDTQHNRRIGEHVDSVLSVYDFEANHTRATPDAKPPVRQIEVTWRVVVDGSKDSLTLPGLRLPARLLSEGIPAPVSVDDEEDDKAFIRWVAKAAPHGYTYYASQDREPKLSDFVIFIFSTFQLQLVEALPLEVEPNGEYPHHEGDPYIANLPEAALRVSQNFMRESYVGLPGRLTRFVITQHTTRQWDAKTASFFPSTVEDCLLHPGWFSKGTSYLDYWRRFLERLQEDSSKNHAMDDVLALTDEFVQSFMVLPDYQNKYYNRITKGHSGKRLPLWDVKPFEKSATADLHTFAPRWMTRHVNGRSVNRVRIAYSVASPAQASYLRRWQENLPIRQTSPNYSRHHPSPPPLEYPWLLRNHAQIVSERGYLAEEIAASRAMRRAPMSFKSQGARANSIGHDWWDPYHRSDLCEVCKVWHRYNPDTMTHAPEKVLDPNSYNLSDLHWDFFACW
ncbi:hypothetical protein QFC19_008955 [Naganishia cerealis]|uniref:Uncharacterized protein n=1 Tax=Naganishia cerealis TaxID=610337 RepID=A0ACC2UY00_9TREE|nr:hypothetical protein QFC19_008955 [Naganishia cerealis]